MSEPTCKTCRFWKKFNRHEAMNYQESVRDKIGCCRRRAPILEGFPPMLAQEWCGEYEPSTEASMTCCICGKNPPDAKKAPLNFVKIPACQQCFSAVLEEVKQKYPELYKSFYSGDSE